MYVPRLSINKIFNVAQEYQDYTTFHGAPQHPTTTITTVYEALLKTTKFQTTLETRTEHLVNE